MICVVSIFANAAGYIPRYFDQIRQLRQLLPEPVRLVSVWGDSHDRTEDLLRARMLPGDDLVACHHRGPVYGSVEHPQRMAQLAKVWQAGFDRVSEGDDWVAYVDSDLIWDPRIVASMLATLSERRDVDLLGPMTFAGDAHYDWWGLRAIDGSRVGPFPPYHHSLKLDEPSEVYSIGAFFVCRGEVARRARFDALDTVVGFCRDARHLGYRCWVDPRLRAHHP